MAVAPKNPGNTVPAPAERVVPERRIQGLANSAAGAIPNPAPASSPALTLTAPNAATWSKTADLRAEIRRDSARRRVAERIASTADKTTTRTMQATASAVAAGKVGMAKAAKISRERALPELGRTSAKMRERMRIERLSQDYRNFLFWLHANVLDHSVEGLLFTPTKGTTPLATLTIGGENRGSGHDYHPTPHYVFNWALSAVDDDLSRFSFVDYGAGKGRVLMLASQHPFGAVGGIEFAEELHDNATMNIAQFPRSRMKCRNVECVLDDVVNVGPPDGEAIHYFFNPFSPDIFATVLKGIVQSYHARPRRLYVIAVDMDVDELMHRTGIFRAIELPPAQRLQARLLSPYKISVYRSLA